MAEKLTGTQKTELPAAFCSRMQKQLGSEYEAFLASYGKPRRQSLRVNTLKGDRDTFRRKGYFSLQPVLWEENGFYYGEEEHPGKHPLHEAGAYYIQESSAMAAAPFLEAFPGERVLDLCAAPGGKSTRLAAGMQGEGILVCNEIHPLRARILSQNMERMGVINGIVLNETPQRLAERFPSYFDKILVDAPCSGEGMFRKDPAAVREWSPENVVNCAARQKEILECAVRMLRNGGVLLYSTCTFAPAEDEEMMEWLQNRYPELEGDDLWEQTQGSRLEQYGFSKGSEAFPGGIRIWPHHAEGEGHFIARFRRKGYSLREGGKEIGKISLSGKIQEAVRLWENFAEETLCAERLNARLPGILSAFRGKGKYVLYGEELYLQPCRENMDGLKVLRPGLHLGTVRKGRMEPAHALAMVLREEEVRNCSVYGMADAFRYFCGETLETDCVKGWTLVSAEGYSAGWGKAAGGRLKNHYPKGLRIMK